MCARSGPPVAVLAEGVHSHSGRAVQADGDYLFSMFHSQPVSFFLRDDFHKEVGWRDFVRDQTSMDDPQCVQQILAHPVRLALGFDPLSRLQHWEPFLPGCMFYFWLVMAGDLSPSFVASDAIFSMILTPRPADAHLTGLPEELLELAHEAWVAPGAPAPLASPLLPLRPEGGRAAVNLLPEMLVLHRFPVGRATLCPCLKTLQALHRDPLAWFAREPRLPGLWG